MIVVLLAATAAGCHKAPPSCATKAQVKLDFTVQDPAGKPVNLSTYRGKPLLINFWATWCGPCKEEIPALIALADKYKNVTVVGISVDDKPADLEKFAADNKVNYVLLTSLDNDELREAYDAQVGVPVSWAVHSNGCPLVTKQGGATREWFEEQFKALL